MGSLFLTLNFTSSLFFILTSFPSDCYIIEYFLPLKIEIIRMHLIIECLALETLQIWRANYLFVLKIVS